MRGCGTAHGSLAYGMAAANHMRASRREDHRAHLTRRVLVPMHRAEQPQRDTRQGKLRLAGHVTAWLDKARGAWDAGGRWLLLRGSGAGRQVVHLGRCDLQLPLQEVAVRNGGRRCGRAFEQHEEEEEAQRQLLREHRVVEEHNPDGGREYAPRCEAYEERAAQAAQRCPDVRIVEQKHAHRPR